MKNLSDSREKKTEAFFKDAVTWTLPEVQGRVINQNIKPESKTNINEVRTFEERIKKQIEAIKHQKDHPTYLTVSQLQDIQKQAYDEAYKQGYDEAYQKGIKDSEQYLQQQTQQQQQELKAKAQQLQNAFNALARPLSDVDSAVEQQLTEMVFYLSRQILDQELKTNPEHITRVLQQSIARLPMSQRNVLIKLNPADIQLMQDNDIDIDDHDWKLEADESISVGGCLVESEAVRIDRRLETRMKELTKQLFSGLSEPDFVATQDDDIESQNTDAGLEVSDE